MDKYLSKADLIRYIHLDMMDFHISELLRVRKFITLIKEERRVNSEFSEAMRSLDVERRKYRRLNITLPVRFKFINKPSERKNVESVNISAGGTRLILHLDNPAEIGDRLDMFIYFPTKSEPIRAQAEVKWVKDYCDEKMKGYEVGVEYQDISVEDKVEIARFVHEYE